MLDADLFAVFAETQEAVVIVKELSEHRVGAGSNLATQVLEIDFQVVGFRMLFRVPRHTDAEIRKVFPNQSDQLVGILQAAIDLHKLLLTGRRIASQRHDVADATGMGRLKPFQQFISRRANTREMCGGCHVEVILDFRTQVDRPVASAAASSVGTGDEGGIPVGGSFQSRKQSFVTSRCFWGEYLDRQPEGQFSINVTDSHRGYSTLNECLAGTGCCD